MVWAAGPRGRRVRTAVAILVAGGSLVAAPPAVAASSAAAFPTSIAAPVAQARPGAARIGSEPDAEAARRLREAFGAASKDVAVVAHDRVSGRTISYNADLENCTGSIVKVMVLLALIEERRDEGRGLTQGQRALARAMIHVSDNDATTSLLRQAGGHAALDRLADKLGLTRTHSAASWGRTSTTAADQARLMGALVGGHPELRADDRSYVLELMAGVSADQRWGVGTVPSGASAQVKNGWVPLEPRGWRVNSIGHVVGGGRDYTVAMLSLDNATMEAGVSHLDRASRIVYEAFGPTTDGSSGAGSAPSMGPAALRAIAPRPLW